MMSPYYHSWLCCSRSIKEVVHPFLASIVKFPMIHLIKTPKSIWKGMLFTLHFQNFNYLYFQLKNEGMDYVGDNFKILKIIQDTNMIITKMNNILVYPKRCLSRCRDMLQLAYEDS